MADETTTNRFDDSPDAADWDPAGYSFLFSAHPEFVDALYREWSADPARVDASWRHFFSGFDLGLRQAAPAPAAADAAARPADRPAAFDPAEFRVVNLIHGYRTRGHLFTRTNPVRTRRTYSPTLDIANFGLTPEDLDKTFQAGAEIGLGPATLREIVAHLEETYCAAIGVEFMFIRHPERVRWLLHRIESTRNRPRFSPEAKRRILERLTRAVVFENFLHSRFTGQKRFALSGNETLIPALEALIAAGARSGVADVVIGMPHRGRLNVLANIMDKPAHDIFEEFEGKRYGDDIFAGDVKYHLGYTRQVTTADGRPVRVELAYNPSHLEAVNPVVEGITRARLDAEHGGDLSRVLPVLIHGDAAVAAQGVVYEVIQMSLLDGYCTGGTIHLVANNQLGFTTNYLDGRSSTYCTDVAKVTLSPVFHVNADDVEAVVLATELALDYRQTFHTDVFIDLLGYRRYGHNESDEPRFTQPKLYKIIAKHPDPRQIYQIRLAKRGEIAAGEAEAMEQAYRAELEAQFAEARAGQLPHCHLRGACDRRRRPADFNFVDSPVTAVSADRLLDVGRKVFTVPADRAIFDKIRRIYDGWLKQLTEEHRGDWAMGETLAYATLLAEGIPIRLSGQDVERGTFSHRHAVLHLEDTEEEYVPLNAIGPGQGRFEAFNSLLSEYGVLGFEYGYAGARPQALVIWEAQFGDFANTAQVIIDQYLAAAEAKWNRLNGLVLFLPHGLEGQGPEHSSARLERFLGLCAHNNMVIANCTTPASLFHLLRRHMKFPARVPLVVFTPKSLLRHPRCVSPLDAFTAGGFEPVLDDETVDPARVRRVLLCSGKIHYDLLQRREADGRDDTALVRMEQLYPVAEAALGRLRDKYAGAGWRWVQEEPENMGAACFVRRKYPIPSLQVIARRESGSPATGFHEIHQLEQRELLDQAFR